MPGVCPNAGARQGQTYIPRASLVIGVSGNNLQQLGEFLQQEIRGGRGQGG